MPQVDQVVLTVDEVDVDVVAVGPVRRPCLRVGEPEAAVLEAAIFAALDSEHVFTAE